MGKSELQRPGLQLTAERHRLWTQLKWWCSVLRWFTAHLFVCWFCNGFFAQKGYPQKTNILSLWFLFMFLPQSNIQTIFPQVLLRPILPANCWFFLYRLPASLSSPSLVTCPHYLGLLPSVLSSSGILVLYRSFTSFFSFTLIVATEAYHINVPQCQRLAFCSNFCVSKADIKVSKTFEGREWETVGKVTETEGLNLSCFASVCLRYSSECQAEDTTTGPVRLV